MPSRRFLISILWVASLLAGAGATAAAPSRDFECLVQPSIEAKISSAVPGILDEVRVDRGAQVTKGQVLATLKSDVERATLDLARSRAAFAARKVERNKELYRKQMISIHEKDELETEWELLKLELRESEERLKLRTITSPIDAVVVRRHHTPGEFVEEEPILELAQIDPLYVEVVVPFSLYGRIKKGSTADVRWENPIAGSYLATVTVVDPVVDAASGTIGVRLEVANPSGRLPAGTKCRVSFPGVSDEAP